jgi:hypothetical protein
MTTMGETNSQNPPATSITPCIAADRSKKVVPGSLAQATDIDEAKPSEEYIVRVRKNQTSVAFTLNTKRMVERREIERANELKRLAGR